VGFSLWDGYRRAAAGDRSGAEADLATILRLPRHLMEEPIIISVLIAASIEREGAT